MNRRRRELNIVAAGTVPPTVAAGEAGIATVGTLSTVGVVVVALVFSDGP